MAQELVRRSKGKNGSQECNASKHHLVTRPSIEVLMEAHDNKTPVEVTLCPHDADSKRAFAQKIVIHSLTPHGKNWSIAGIAYGTGVPFTGIIPAGREIKGFFSFKCHAVD